jgi:hypothetical protein
MQRSAATRSSVDKIAGIVCLTVGKPENVACFHVTVDSVPYGNDILAIKTTNNIYIFQRSQFIMFM